MNESQRIEELLHHFRMEQKDFAQKCGFEANIISNIKRKKSGISRKVYDKIIMAFPEINKKWLSDGEGDMLNNSINQSIVGNNNENCQNIGNNNNDDIPAWVNVLLSEKDERIKEKDERIKEKDERIKEKDERIAELKEVIRELKSK